MPLSQSDANYLGLRPANLPRPRPQARNRTDVKDTAEDNTSPTSAQLLSNVFDVAQESSRRLDNACSMSKSSVSFILSTPLRDCLGILSAALPSVKLVQTTVGSRQRQLARLRVLTLAARGSTLKVNLRTQILKYF